MATLSRLKGDEISNGNIINADDLDAEFDQLINGHNSHDTRLDTIESTSLTAAANNNFTGNNTFAGKVQVKDKGKITISSGVVTATGANHTIDTEGAAASDDLDTISGGADGAVLFVQADDGTHTVVLKHDTGNIYNPTGKDITLDDEYKIVKLLYQSALSKWIVVADFAAMTTLSDTTISSPTTGQVLTYNSGAWVNGEPGSVVRIESQTISSDTSIDFTTGIDSTYQQFVIYFTDIVLATDDKNLWLRVSEDAGGSWKSGASDYTWTHAQSNSSTTTGGSTGDTKIILSSYGTTGTTMLGNASGEAFSGRIVIANPSATGTRKRVYGQACYTIAAGNMSHGTIAGAYIGTTNAITGIRILADGVNLTSGQIDLYGVL